MKVNKKKIGETKLSNQSLAGSINQNSKKEVKILKSKNRIITNPLQYTKVNAFPFYGNVEYFLGGENVNKKEKKCIIDKTMNEEFCSSLNSNKLNYTIKQYIEDIDKYGLTDVWIGIISLFEDENDAYGVLTINNFGELYEIGLAHTNKISKKEYGKYFTPNDISKVMSEWFADLKGESICDVCCGTGNLIISFLSTLKPSKAKKLISSGKIYIYDQDELALYICQSTIGIIYGKENASKINCICGDFLDQKIKLPSNCKVISNPPYFKIKENKKSWEITDVIIDTKEFYSSIMEKIIKKSQASVIITPYSFIGGSKFYSLRKIMNDYNGFIVSFDNIPGAIFSGRKHGIFNSNSTNSVRAAITVVENKKTKKGFRCSPLIRFKNEERSLLLQKEKLESFIGNRHQIVNDKNKRYAKCFPEMESILDSWNKNSNKKLSDLTNPDGLYKICVPNTCRYHSVGTKKDLDRVGKITLSFDNKEYFHYAYCLTNSSFCYWHWRLFDGGITYQSSLLNEIPVFFDKISDEDKEILSKIAIDMQEHEDNYLVYKKNAGKLQENVKFPKKYKNIINEIFLKTLGISKMSYDFDIIHSNTAFKKEVFE